MIQPDKMAFRSYVRKGNVIPVFREILADLDTPVSAFLKVASEEPYGFLLESVHGGEKWGRYSIIGIDPEHIFSIQGNSVTLSHPFEGESATESFEVDDPFEALREYMQRFNPVEFPGMPRFHGGAVGYMSYDMVRCFESIPNDNPQSLETPDALFVFPRSVLIFDNLLGKMKVVVNVEVDETEQSDELYDDAVVRIEAITALLRKPLPAQNPGPAGAEVKESDFTSEMSRDAFEEAVRRGKEYIAAGDIMQVVLSQRLSIPFALPAASLYRALRTTNPSPYLFLFNMDSFSLVGSSPEILVRQDGDQATVRPIAGTRPRGATEEEDKALEEELLADPKELAEHIMLVDLGRNDLGRIAKTGTVKVTEQMVIERYSHVMHIVSNVDAILKPELDAFDVIAATFPAGTVSGAPKIRAMEIIDELEVSQRGCYAGAVGYVSYSGHMDLAITIRTAVIKDGTLSIQAGAGIVADSDPAREYDETMNKARTIFRSVDLAQRGLE
ncbi:MAG: anthranilate synthase component I [Magnetococcales bacterium]|nr:anthranilate synthase component I [Magnetococcales bacterium]